MEGSAYEDDVEDAGDEQQPGRTADERFGAASTCNMRVSRQSMQRDGISRGSPYFLASSRQPNTTMTMPST
jgi:hypothetical protein